MNVTETLSDGLKRELKVVLSTAVIDELVNIRLKEIAPTLNLPGFRAGRVPVSLIKKRYGRSIWGEVVEKAVKDAVQKAMEKEDRVPVRSPEVRMTDDKALEPGRDVAFTLSYEVTPTIVPMDFSELTIERLKVEVPEEIVDEVLNRLSESIQEALPVDPPRPAAEKDTVIVDFEGFVDGEPFPGGKADDYQLELGSGAFIAGFEEQLVGLEIDRPTEITVAFPDDYGAEDLAGKEALFKVKIKQILEKRRVPIDDDFAVKRGAANLDDFRSQIRKGLEQEKVQDSRLHTKRILMDKLDAAHKFELPTGLVQNEIEAIRKELEGAEQRASKEASATGQDSAPVTESESESETTEAQDGAGEPKSADAAPTSEESPQATAAALLKSEAEMAAIAERRVRLGLLLAEIGRVNNISVSEEELTRAINMEARRYPGQSAQVVEFFRSHPEAMTQLRAPIYEEKVVDFILEMATVTDRLVSLEELNAALEEDESRSLLAEPPA